MSFVASVKRFFNQGDHANMKYSLLEHTETVWVVKHDANGRITQVKSTTDLPDEIKHAGEHSIAGTENLLPNSRLGIKWTKHHKTSQDITMDYKPCASYRMVQDGGVSKCVYVFGPALSPKLRQNEKGSLIVATSGKRLAELVKLNLKPTHTNSTSGYWMVLQTPTRDIDVVIHVTPHGENACVIDQTFVVSAKEL